MRLVVPAALGLLWTGLALAEPPVVETPAVTPRVAAVAAPAIEVVTTPTALDERLRKLGAGGKSVVVHFFAMWCEPCREEMPVLAKALAKLPADVKVLLVSLDPVATGPDKIPEFLGNFGLSGRPTVLLDAPDPLPVTERFSRRWEAELPATFVWRDGKPRAERLTKLANDGTLLELLQAATTPGRRPPPSP